MPDIELDIDDKGWSRERWLAADEGLLKQQLNRGLKPTGELPMHWYLQRDLSQTSHARVVLHLHPTHVIAATRYLLSRKEGDTGSMRWLASEYPEIFRYTRVGEILGYVEPISQALADGVERIMLNGGNSLHCDVVAMDRPGAVSVGSDPWEAFEHIEHLNHICEIFLLSR